LSRKFKSGPADPVFMPRTDNLTVSTVDVGNAAEVILAANPLRAGFIIKNTDTVDTVYLGNASVTAGTAAGSNRGLALGPGQTLSSSQVDGYVGLIWGICSGASALVNVWEWTHES
jgi:hypothetical protein